LFENCGVGAGDAGDAAASPTKFFLANFGKNCANLGKIWANLGKICSNLVILTFGYMVKFD